MRSILHILQDALRRLWPQPVAATRDDSLKAGHSLAVLLDVRNLEPSINIFTGQERPSPLYAEYIHAAVDVMQTYLQLHHDQYVA